MKKERRGRSQGGPHPRQVPGYDDARRAGGLPGVPDQPPTLDVRPTANGLFLRFVAFAGGGLAAILAVVLLLGALDVPDAWRAPVFGVLGLAWFVLLFRRLSAVGRQSAAELQRGYTTLVLDFGGFWVGEGPLTLSGDMRAAWDYRGTWHLGHRDGHVIRAPDRSIDPPGMYPSPHRPGQYELWTGATWLGHYAD